MLKEKYKFLKTLIKNTPVNIRNIYIIIFAWTIVLVSSIFTGIHASIETFIATFLGAMFVIAIDINLNPYTFKVGGRYQTRNGCIVTILKKTKINGVSGFVYTCSLQENDVFVMLNGMAHFDGVTISKYDMMLGDVPKGYAQ